MSKYNKPLGESGIEWTNRTWNPTTGCTKVSPGCKNCYAEPLAKRLQSMNNPRYRNGFKPTIHADKLAEPMRWQSPEWVFVNSMSDLLHEAFPDSFVVDAVEAMHRANWHRYQVLTKRPQRWASITEQVIERLGHWPRNVLPGTSLESRAVIDGYAKIPARLEAMRHAGDADTIRMISAEPLIASLVAEGKTAADLGDELRAAGIGWVITGGESTHKSKYRAADLDWFREVRDACAHAGIPFFHKQHGGPGITKDIKRGGKLAMLDGELHHEMPDVWRGLTPKERRAEAKQAQASLL